MLKKWLSYWLVVMVVMVAMQSFAAIADIHQAHQSAGEHLTFEHEHAKTPSNVPLPERLKKATKLPSDGLDCHHCCHCHLHLNYLPTPSLGFLLSYKSLRFNEYNNSALSGLLASLFRPPKHNSTTI